MRPFLVLLSTFILFMACGAKAEPYKVAFIPKGATHAFWKEMSRGAEVAAKQLNVDMVWRGPTNEEGVEAQGIIMSLYTRSKFNGIIIAPNSQTQLAKSIAEAVSQDVKLVIVDSPLTAKDSFPYVGTNNEKAGALAARQVVKDLPRAKKILLYRYSPQHGSTSEREKGFLTTIKKLLPKAEVNDAYYSGVTVAEAERKLHDILANNKDFDVIFTPNESGTEGTIKALKSANLSSKVKHYGFDFSSAINEGLLSGALAGVVIQDPYLMGQKAMQLMIDIFNKKSVPAITETPAVMVTRKNIASADVKAKTDPFIRVAAP